MVLDRTTPPPFQPIPSIAFPWPKQGTIQSTIPLFVWQEDTWPLLSLHMLFDSGSWHDPAPGVAYLTGKMLLEGTTTKDYQAIASYIDHYGASLSVTTSPDYTLVKLTCLAKHSANMIEFLSALLADSIFPADRLEQTQHLVIQSLTVENEKNQTIASKQFKAALLGKEHPYGYSIEIEAIQAVTQKQLLAYYQKNLHHGCRILVSSASTSTAISALEKGMAFLPTNTLTSPLHPLPTKKPVREHFPKKGSLQTAIYIGKVTIPKTHPDYIPLSIATTLLGGYFGSRLMRSVREEKGYTYHIHATLHPLQKASFFFITTEAIQQYAQQTCQAIYHEIETLQTQLVPMEEIITLRNYWLGNFLSTTNDPLGWIKRFKEVYLYGLGQDFYQQFYTKLHTISPEKIRTMAQTYWQIDDLTEISVG